MEKKNSNELETLHEIRSLMERSSRFISLSGLSGVFAGIYALLGAGAVWYKAGNHYDYLAWLIRNTEHEYSFILFLFFVAFLVLLFSIATGIVLTTKRAKKNNQTIWDSTAKRLLINLLIPLVTGGLFCLILINHKLIGLVPPATLIFYGLGLVNASKYTLNDIRYLGYCEIAIGLASSLFLGFGLLFWALGFGVMHIAYGTIMYMRYERNG